MNVPPFGRVVVVVVVAVVVVVGKSSPAESRNCWVSVFGVTEKLGIFFISSGRTHRRRSHSPTRPPLDLLNEAEKLWSLF